METIYEVSTWVIPIILAITVHEAAHGWMANRLGDDTAKRSGRITLNPLAHIDPVGTILMPGLLLMTGLPPFGYAKPVPVMFGRLDDPKRDMVWVAAAGPGVNVLMAVVAILLLNLFAYSQGPVGEWFSQTLLQMVWINLVLAVFNMIPVPPLDGGRVATGLLPMPLAQKYAQLERYGMLFIFGIILVPYLLRSVLGIDLNILAMTILPAVEFLYDLLINLFFFIR